MSNSTDKSTIAISDLSPIDKVLHFWNNVWSSPYNLDLIDELMVEDFKITNSGTEIRGREAFKKWVGDFLKVVPESNLETLDIFESKDGTKVVSTWIFTGKNNGIFGLQPDGRPISFTGTAIWEIRDNKLAHNRVERSGLELYQRLTQDIQK